MKVLAHSLADAKSDFAAFDSGQVHYRTVGEGRSTLLFVHGWSCHGGFWREQVPALAETSRLILIDLPGHGQSDKPQVNYTMDFLASAVLAVLHDAHVAQATLVGHSMGTPVICRAYAQAPDKVAGLVAVDGFLRRPAVTPEYVEKVIAPYHRPDYRDHATRYITSMFPRPGTEALRERVLSEMLATPQHVMGSAMAGMFDLSQPAWDLPKVTIPVLAIHAKHSRWTPEYEAYVRSRSPRADYRVLEGTGHFVMLEKPAEFNAALREMLHQSG